LKSADGNFPQDFSLLMAVRPPKGSKTVLLTIYSDVGDEQISVTLGKQVELFYRDEDGRPVENKKATVKFNVTVNDGK
jgi:hypothetical protein